MVNFAFRWNQILLMIWKHQNSLKTDNNIIQNNAQNIRTTRNKFFTCISWDKMSADITDPDTDFLPKKSSPICYGAGHEYNAPQQNWCIKGISLQLLYFMSVTEF